MATTTLSTIEIEQTTRLLKKYLPSGTVLQMSLNGWKVTWLGHHSNLPCTSPNGFTELVKSTHIGTSTKSVSTVRITTRKTLKDSGSRTTGPPVEDEQVGTRDHQQEEEQQHRHRRSEAEVPVDERRTVDVHGDDVGALRRLGAEEHERRVEVVERPEEEHQDHHQVDRPQRRHGDVA